MRTAKKTILLALCAVMLVVGTMMGTLAYLTDDASVTNTFSIGQVTLDGMDEAEVDLYGQVISNQRVQENEYKLLPGHTYVKDPIIYVNDDSEDCYLFVKVVNEIEAIEAEEGVTEVHEQMAANGWKFVATEGEAKIYIYAEGQADKTPVAGGSDVPVFQSFTLMGDGLDGTMLDAYDGKTIVVTAHAIQKDGMESSTPAQIWTAGFGTP